MPASVTTIRSARCSRAHRTIHSTFAFAPQWLPDLANAERTALPGALHLGTLATVVEPGASVLLDWASPPPATART